MQIGVYGSGYLGTVVSACLADFGSPVSCCHEDSSRMVEMSQGKVPFHEKNLADMIRRNVRSGRLSYSTDIEAFARKAQIIFLAEDANDHLASLCKRIAAASQRSPILVVMTPGLVGASSALEASLKEAGLKATLVTQPTFFTAGCAVEDFNWPDRIVLGTTSSEAVLALKQVFHPLVMRGVPVIVTNHETVELLRVASTAFLATKISFINLSLALGLDKKIAPRCLQPGAGMGGLFAETDMDSLSQLATNHGIVMKVLGAAREVNEDLTGHLISKIAAAVKSIQGTQVGMLGLAFKPNTNAVEGSSAMRLAEELAVQGAKVRAYDPVAMPNAKLRLNGQVLYCDSAYAAVEGADALVVGTGWPEFRSLDFDRIKHLVKRAVIVDTKNLLDGARMRSLGFEYVGVGRREVAQVLAAGAK